MLKRKTPLKRRRKRKMSELTPKEQEKRREKFAFNRVLSEVDALSRELAWLVWGNWCRWPLCKQGDSPNIQWHHFITRDVWSVRWDPDNLIPLHNGCHKYGAHGKHSHYAYDVQIGRMGKARFEALMLKKNTDHTVKRTMETLENKKKELKDEIKRLGNSL